MSKKGICAILAILAVGTLVNEARADRIAARQRNQIARIREGVKNGELTKREARHLKHQQEKIKATEEKALKDGVVTEQEKAKLERMQDKASRMITRAKHNDITSDKAAKPAVPAVPAVPKVDGAPTVPAIPAVPAVPAKPKLPGSN